MEDIEEKTMNMNDEGNMLCLCKRTLMECESEWLLSSTADTIADYIPTIGY